MGQLELRSQHAIGATVKRLQSGFYRDELPSTWVAETMDGLVVGVAQLKYREVPKLSDFEHWLGGVYVDPGFRRRGVARQLIQGCTDEAKDLGIKRLYLQTELYNVDLYARAGWTTIDLPAGAVHERSVMIRAVDC